MKNAARAILISATAIAAILATPGLADARTAPKGATVEYGWISDVVKNDISYYGKDGKLIKRSVRYHALPVGFGPEKFAYGVKIRTTKNQTIGSRATSGDMFSSCTIKVNGRQVASGRQNAGLGKSRC